MKTQSQSTKTLTPYATDATAVITEIELGHRYRAKDRRTIRGVIQTLKIKPMLVGLGARRFYRMIDVLKAEERAASGK